MSVTRTTCPFCLNGCESGVSFDYQYRMEYQLDGKVNRGRLCPRGNSASIVLDNPRRLAYPLLNGKETSWQDAVAMLRAWVGSAKPEEIAVVQSRGLTGEESKLIRGFAQTLGTRNLVCGYIDPDNSFRYRLTDTRAATLDDIRSAKAMLLVGDVFSTSPVAAGPILEARYADRKNRLVVIDSLRTRQSGFAHQFIQVRPGAEPFALLALAGILMKSEGRSQKSEGMTADIDIDRYAALAGVNRATLDAAAGTLKASDKGFVGCAMHFGRVKYPALMSLAAQLVAAGLKASFNGFAETSVPEGTMKFSEFRKACGEGRIKVLLWFGALYPYSYPEVLPELAEVEHRAATAIFRPDDDLPGLLLPVVSELEKESKGGSYWGEIERRPLAAPLSGTRMPGWVMEQVAKPSLLPVEPPARFDSAEVVKLGAEYAAEEGKAADGLLLVGEKRAIGIGGFYTAESEAKFNPDDAARLGLAEDVMVVIAGPVAEGLFRVSLSGSVPSGVVAIGVNAHRNRALFPLKADSILGETVIPPVEIQITRSEQKPALPVEVKREG